MKFEHQISEETYHTEPETEELYCFYCTMLNFEWKIAKTMHYVLIGARWGETLLRHMIDFNQWKHAKIKCWTIKGHTEQRCASFSASCSFFKQIEQLTGH